MRKRFLAIVLTLCMALTMLPATAFSNEIPMQGTSEACTHHVHDEKCGYMEATQEAIAQPCTFDAATCEICHPKNSDEALSEPDTAQPKTAAPSTATAEAVKETEIQAAVSFTLNNEPIYNDTAVWAVYDNNTAATPLADTNVTYDANTLTLSHDENITAATYYVSVKEIDMIESERLALTVLEAAPKAAIIMPLANQSGEVVLDTAEITSFVPGTTYIIEGTAGLDKLAELIKEPIRDIPQMINTEVSDEVLEEPSEPANTTGRGCTFRLADTFDNSAEPFRGTIGAYKEEQGSESHKILINDYFDGTFDGNGKTIVLDINHDADAADCSTGLFGYIGEGGTVKNLTVSGSVTNDFDDCYYIGGIAGVNTGDVENCKNTANVSGLHARNVGGITGCGIVGSISGCINTGDIEGAMLVGGIAGQQANCHIINCYNTGAISGIEDIGGIAGMKQYSAPMEYCYNIGAVVGERNVGGITGSANTVSNCISLGVSVKADEHSNRIVGNVLHLENSRENGQNGENKARANMLVSIGNIQEEPLDGISVTVGASTLLSGVFDGWDDTAWTVPTGSLMVGGNLPTLKAFTNWQRPILPGNGGYMVTFDDNGASTPAFPQSMISAEDMPLGTSLEDAPIVQPTKTNYTFKGWSTSSEETAAPNFTEATPVHRDMTVYAVWQEDTQPISAFELSYERNENGKYTVTIPTDGDPSGYQYSFDGSEYSDTTTIEKDQGETVTGYKKTGDYTRASASVTMPKQWEYFTVANNRKTFFTPYELNNCNTGYFSNFATYLRGRPGGESKLKKLRQENNSAWGGSCFGFAAVEGLYNQEKMNISAIEGEKTLSQLSKPVKNHRVRDLLNYYYLTQFLPYDIQRSQYQIGTEAGTQKLEELVNAVKAGEKVMFCYFFGDSGHAFTIDGYEGIKNGNHILTAHDNRVYSYSYDEEQKNPLTLDVKIPANFKTCTVEFPTEENEIGFYIEGDGLYEFENNISEKVKAFECYYDFNGASNDATRFDPLAINELKSGRIAQSQYNNNDGNETYLDVAAGENYTITFSDGREITVTDGKAEGGYDRQTYILKEGTLPAIGEGSVTSGTELNQNPVSYLYSITAAGDTEFELTDTDDSTPTVISVVSNDTFAQFTADVTGDVTTNNTTGALRATGASGAFSATVSISGDGTVTVSGTLPENSTVSLIPMGDRVQFIAPPGTYQVSIYRNGVTSTHTIVSDGSAIIITPPTSGGDDGNGGGGGGNIASEVKSDSLDFTSSEKGMTVRLSQSLLDRLISERVNPLTLRSDILTLTLDLNALKQLRSQSDGDVIITVNTQDVKKLSAEAQALIGGRPVFTVTVNGQKKGQQVSITDLGNGRIGFHIPYTKASGEVNGNLIGVYVDSDGNAHEIAGSKYDDEVKMLSCETNHLSIYGVGYKVAKPAAPTFTDIAGHWAEDDILFVTGRGLFAGTGGNEFSPDGTMTRAMFVTTLGRLAGVDPGKYKTSRFTDVHPTDYFFGYVEWAAEQGIVKGITTTIFNPNAYITRQEMATIMTNYAKAMKDTIPQMHSAVEFADKDDIKVWARDAVAFMQRAGLMQGRGNNQFEPCGTATRAEAATVLHQYLGITVDMKTK